MNSIYIHLELVIGLLYKAASDDCWHECTSPAEATDLPHEGASALDRMSCSPMLCIAVLVHGRHQQSGAEVSCGKRQIADAQQGWLAAATA